MDDLRPCLSFFENIGNVKYVSHLIKRGLQIAATFCYPLFHFSSAKCCLFLCKRYQAPHTINGPMQTTPATPTTYGQYIVKILSRSITFSVLDAFRRAREKTTATPPQTEIGNK